MELVPGNSNPADILSRGVTAKAYLKSDVWFNGPKWLSEKSKWPVTVSQISDVSIYHEENIENVCFTNVTQNSEHVINLNHFSAIGRLFRVTVMVFKFISYLKQKVGKSEGSLSSSRIIDISLNDSCVSLPRIYRRVQFLGHLTRRVTGLTLCPPPRSSRILSFALTYSHDSLILMHPAIDTVWRWPCLPRFGLL